MKVMITFAAVAVSLVAGCSRQTEPVSLPFAYLATEQQAINIVSDYCVHHCEKFSISRYVDDNMVVTGRARKFYAHFGHDLDVHLSQYGWEVHWYAITFRDDRDFWFGFARDDTGGMTEQ